MMATKEIQISEIVVDPRLQLRVKGTDKAFVDEYRQDIENGAVFPPVTVFREQNGKFWLADGFHTVEAHRLAGKRYVSAIVKMGGFPQALEFAAGANDSHGIRRTHADKRKAIRALLESGWISASSRSIAKVVNCHHETVEDERSKLQCSGIEDTARTGADGKARRNKHKEDLACDDCSFHVDDDVSDSDSIISDSERLFEDAFCEMLLKDSQIISRQVRCSVGVADVVTESHVYELKLHLSMSNVFRAIGQAIMYSQALGFGRRPAIACKSMSGISNEFLKHIRAVGVEVINCEWS